MNIVKEYIKVEIVNPTWRKTLKQIKKDKNKKIILIGTPAHGNLGDHAIAEEEKNFIKNITKNIIYMKLLCHCTIYVKIN